VTIAPASANTAATPAATVAILAGPGGVDAASVNVGQAAEVPRLRLAKAYGAERLEAGCLRAERLGSSRYRTVKNILASGADRCLFEDETPSTAPLPVHENVRGAGYYAGQEAEC